MYLNVLIFRTVQNRPPSGGISAANLIDAIITHQINQASVEPPVNRNCHRPSFVSDHKLF